MAIQNEIIASDNLAGRQYLRPEFSKRIEQGDATMQSLASAHENYRSFYEKMKAAVVQRDPASTEAGHFLEMRELAFKKVKRAAETSDRVMETAKAEVAAARTALKTNLGLVEDHRAAEIRSHLRGLSDEARASILQNAVNAGDGKTVAAVIAAPAYLSGVSDERHGSLKDQYEYTHGGDLPARIRDLEKAMEINRKTADDALRFLDRLLPHEKYQKIIKDQAAAKAVREQLGD